MIKYLSAICLCLFFLSACQTTPAPVTEYALARSAIDAARSAQAPRLSAGYWHQADEFYRRARAYYKDREYDKAKDLFIQARLMAEKAENSARLIRLKTGEVL